MRPPTTKRGITQPLSRWAVALLKQLSASGTASWTLEQVNNPELRVAFDEVGVDFAVVVCCDYRDGVAQTRTRIFAGPKPFVDALKLAKERMPSVTPRDVLENAIFTPPHHTLCYISYL